MGAEAGAWLLGRRLRAQGLPGAVAGPCLHRTHSASGALPHLQGPQPQYHEGSWPTSDSFLCPQRPWLPRQSRPQTPAISFILISTLRKRYQTNHMGPWHLQVTTYSTVRASARAQGSTLGPQGRGRPPPQVSEGAAAKPGCRFSRCQCLPSIPV